MAQSSLRNNKRLFSVSGGDPSLPDRVTYLENNEYKILYFQTISATTGTITKPTNSTILLDQFYEGGDAIVETLVNGQPSGQSPLTAGGAVVSVSSFDTSGNFTLSGTPSSFDVALVYILKIKAVYYQNLTTANIMAMEDLNPVTQTITNGDTTHAPSSDAVKSYSDAKVGSAMTQAINEAKGADIASASTTDIGAATGNFVHITGTTTITALGTIQAGTRRIVRFAGILTLTHNATSLILPTGANITTAANDVATFVSEGSGNWRCVNYMRADGSALASGLSGTSNEIAYFNSATSVSSLSTSTYPSLTELSRVKGLTSPVQTQLDNKVSYTMGAITSNFASPADSTTYYTYLGGGAPLLTATQVGIQFAKTGTINTFQITGFHSTNASNESVSFYLRNVTTGTDYTITTSWDDSYGANTNITRTYTGLNIPIGNTTDKWILKVVTPTFGTNPTNWQFIFSYIIEF